jgi:hypothetical protein
MTVMIVDLQSQVPKAVLRPGSDGYGASIPWKPLWPIPVDV